MHKIKKPSVLVPIFVLLLATFFHFYNIYPFVTFLGDQGRDSIILRRIVTLEHFPAIGAPSSVGGIFLGPFYYYLVAPFLLLFNFNPIGPAIGVALLSLVGLACAYLVLRKEISTVSALIFLILASFSTVLTDLSRFSWNPNLLPFFSFFTLYFFYKTLTKKRLFWAFLFGMFFSFSVQLHYLALLMVFSMIIIFSYSLLQKKLGKKDILSVFLSITSFILFSSPLILFDLRHQFLNSKNFIKLFSQKDVVSKSSLFSRFLDTNSAFYKHIFQISIEPYTALLLSIGILAAAIFILRKKNNAFIMINTVNVFVFILSFSLLNSFRHPHYYGSILLSFFVVTSYLLDFGLAHKYWKRLLLVIIIGVYCFLNIKQYHFLWTQGSYQIDRARRIATSIHDHIKLSPYQLASIPDTETDGHIRYFLEVQGKRPLPEDSHEDPVELFVLCYTKCEVIANPQWQIAAFKNAKIDTIWRIENITIYKLIHAR